MTSAYSGGCRGRRQGGRGSAEARLSTELSPRGIRVLLQEQTEQAAEAYHKLEKTNPSDAATGLADLAVYQGRFSDAVEILEKGAADGYGRTQARPGCRRHEVVGAGQRAGLARPKSAGARRREARARTQPGVPNQIRRGAGLRRARRSAKAKKLAAGLASELQIEPQAYAKLIEGEAALKAGDGRGGGQALHRRQ